MKILSISGILPIPQFIIDNDFVYNTYINYRKVYRNDEVVIINPIKYNLNPISNLRGNTKLKKLNRKLGWNIFDLPVEIFAYFSSWRLRNFHSIITSTVYYLNKKRLRALFSKYNFDIIHAQYIFPDGLLAYYLSRMHNIPYIVTSHNERFYFKHSLSKKRALNILKGASFVTPINYSNYLYYKSLQLKNIKLIPLGFNESFLRDQKKEQQSTTKIFTVANLIKLKNIDKIILAFSRLVQKYDITLTIIGDGPERNKLHNLSHSLNLEKHTNFINHVPHDQISDTIYRFDIFIMPSFFETFGRVYFECMAMGIPVICAKNSGIFGIFKNYEEAIAVDHTNIDEITEALEYLVSKPDERLRIGLNGQNLVNKYTWKNIAKTLHYLYTDALK